MKKQEVVLYLKCFVFCTGQKLAWISMKSYIRFVFSCITLCWQLASSFSEWQANVTMMSSSRSLLHRILLDVKVLARLVPLTCDSIQKSTMEMRTDEHLNDLITPHASSFHLHEIVWNSHTRTCCGTFTDITEHEVLRRHVHSFTEKWGRTADVVLVT